MAFLEINNITYSYDRKRTILNGLAAHMETGKLYAILGPSGSAKQHCFLCWEA